MLMRRKINFKTLLKEQKHMVDKLSTWIWCDSRKKKFHEYSTFTLNQSLMKECFLAMVIEQDTGMLQLVWDEKPTQIHVHLSFKQTKNHSFWQNMSAQL